MAQMEVPAQKMSEKEEERRERVALFAKFCDSTEALTKSLEILKQNFDKSGNLVDSIKSAFEKYGENDWIHRMNEFPRPPEMTNQEYALLSRGEHLGFGMQVRNSLRTAKIIEESSLPTGNWDDIYIPLIEVALGLREIPNQQKIKRICTRDYENLNVTIGYDFLAKMQDTIGEWAARNFDTTCPFDPILGLVEEAGEICAAANIHPVAQLAGKMTHHQLKAIQGIRGTRTEHEAKFHIYRLALIDLLQKMEFCQDDLRNPTDLPNIPEVVDGIADVMIYAADASYRLGFNLGFETEATVNKILKRDWEKHRKTGETPE